MAPKLDPIAVCIETDRLLVRPPKSGDGAAHHKAVQASLAELRHATAALPWAHEDQSADHSEKYCAWANGEFAACKEFPLLFILRQTQQIIGASGLHTPDWSVPSFEIGWWCCTDFSGQGLITEGVDAVLNWGFETLGARRIFAEVDEDNVRSRRVCERAGMTFEGVMSNARRTHEGQLCNCRLYASVR